MINYIYDLYGKNIGHYLPDKIFLIDMHGYYLGEIVDKNRLLYNNYSPYKSIYYEAYGNYGNFGKIGSCFYAEYLAVKI